MSNDRNPRPQRCAGSRAALVAAVIAAGGLVGAATGSTQAAPLAPAPTGTLAAQSGVVAVHGWRYGGWGRHHGWGHRHGWHRGPRWGWGWGHHHHHGWRHGGWRHHHRW